MADLYRVNHTLSQWNTGGAYLHFLYEIDNYKLITGIECEFPAIKAKQIALLDTGAELSIAGSQIYQAYSYEQVFLDTPVGIATINTRLGNFAGSWYRVEVSLKADWGEELIIEGTFLFCEAWTGPTVLGLHGFLERIRFAIDPDYENIGCIYFAAT